MLKKSVEYSLYGDLDGKTVADLREMLSEYSDDAIIDVRSEASKWNNDYRDFFVIMEKDKE